MSIEEMKLRKRNLGYTNEQIASLSGVPLGTVQKIFSGETTAPRFNTIKKLELALGLRARESEYSFSIDEVKIAEPVALGLDFYNNKREQDRINKKIFNSEYAPLSVDKRIGVAAGKFLVPDDSYFYDDEIAEMFEEI